MTKICIAIKVRSFKRMGKTFNVILTKLYKVHDMKKKKANM